MIRNTGDLAAYLYLESPSQEAIANWVLGKARESKVSFGGHEQVEGAKVTKLGEAQGMLVDDCIQWSSLKVNSMPLAPDKVPQEFRDLLEAELVNGVLCSPKSYRETINRFMAKPTKYCKALGSNGGFYLMFKVQVPSIKMTRGTLTLERNGNSVLLTFPFSEQDWDDAIQELKYL